MSILVKKSLATSYNSGLRLVKSFHLARNHANFVDKDAIGNRVRSFSSVLFPSRGTEHASYKSANYSPSITSKCPWPEKPAVNKRERIKILEEKGCEPDHCEAIALLIVEHLQNKLAEANSEYNEAKVEVRRITRFQVRKLIRFKREMNKAQKKRYLGLDDLASSVRKDMETCLLNQSASRRSVLLQALVVMVMLLVASSLCIACALLFRLKETH